MGSSSYNYISPTQILDFPTSYRNQWESISCIQLALHTMHTGDHCSASMANILRTAGSKIAWLPSRKQLGDLTVVLTEAKLKEKKNK